MSVSFVGHVIGREEAHDHLAVRGRGSREHAWYELPYFFELRRNISVVPRLQATSRLQSVIRLECGA